MLYDSMHLERLLGGSLLRLYILTRFDNIHPELVIGELHGLKRTETVEELIEKFEELKSYPQIFIKELPEDYFPSRFINKLRDDIKGATVVVKPKIFEEAFSMARKYEGCVLKYRVKDLRHG